MQIIYESMLEFANAVEVCANNRDIGRCEYCIFFDGCPIDEPENRMIMHGIIQQPCIVEDIIERTLVQHDND